VGGTRHITRLTAAENAATDYRKAKRFDDRSLIEKVDNLEGIRGQRISRDIVLCNIMQSKESKMNHILNVIQCSSWINFGQAFLTINSQVRLT